MQKVISNSSTLIHLSMLNHLELLHQFYDHILIPPAVWREVVTEGKGRAGAREVHKAFKKKWLKVAIPSNKKLLLLLKKDLDSGEAEAIALAIQHKASLILLDESNARKIAHLYGLKVTGIIGILIKAKMERKISSLRIELEKLRQYASFWINKDVFKNALECVNEPYEE